MQIIFSPRIRSTLYIITAIGTPIVTYLLAKGLIGNLEVGLWSSEVAAVGMLAAFNTKD
jgi:hypothetical protein